MQPLTTTLIAAQKSLDRAPAISALVSDVPPEVARLAELTSLYSGSEPDAAFDAAITALGTVVRAYVSGTTVFAQVIGNPGNSSQWSTWTTLDTAAQPSHIAVRASSSDGSAEVFWVASNGTTIRYTSFNGSTWDPGGPYPVVDVGAGNAVGGLASSGYDATIRLFYAVNPPTPGTGWIAETHNTGGTSWSAPSQNNQPRYPVSGLGADLSGYDGNSYVLIADGSPPRLSLLTWVPGAGWSSGATLYQANSGSGYSYAYPRLREKRTVSDRQQISWLETSAAGTTAQLCFTPTHLWLTEVVPWRFAAAHGVRILRSDLAPTWYILTSNQAYSVPADTANSATGQRVTLPLSLIDGFVIEEPGPLQPARGTLTIINEDAQFADAGQAGPHRSLRPWSQVALSLGYHSGQGASGDETVWQTPYWIDAVEFHDDPVRGQPLITLHLIDAWTLLERFVVRSQTVFTSQTIEYIIQRIWWRVCGRLESDPNSQMDIVVPSFTVHAGENYATATRRLCLTAGVLLRFATNPSGTSIDGTGWDSVLPQVIAWAPNGPSLYSYGSQAGGHPIVAGAPANTAPSATHVEVYGQGSTALARNWSQTWLLWHDVARKVVDKTLTSSANVASVAANVLTQLGPEANGGTIDAWANVGLQVGDCIDLTIASAGLSAALRTVYGLTTRFDRPTNALIQTIKLQGVNS